MRAWRRRDIERDATWMELSWRRRWRGTWNLTMVGGGGGIASHREVVVVVVDAAGSAAERARRVHGPPHRSAHSPGMDGDGGERWWTAFRL